MDEQLEMFHDRSQNNLELSIDGELHRFPPAFEEYRESIKRWCEVQVPSGSMSWLFETIHRHTDAPYTATEAPIREQPIHRKFWPRVWAAITNKPVTQKAPAKFVVEIIILSEEDLSELRKELDEGRPVGVCIELHVRHPRRVLSGWL